jgi:hypothetical protein
VLARLLHPRLRAEYLEGLAELLHDVEAPSVGRHVTRLARVAIDLSTRRDCLTSGEVAACP